MKHLLKLVSLFILALFLSSCADQITDNNYTTDEALKDAVLVPGDLSPEEIAGLIYMRQEEKVAHDVYTVLGQSWNLNLLTNIASSEQSHMDAVKKMINKYQLEDPVTDETVGVFTDPVFQTMYDDLVMQGQQSVSETMLVGEAIETKDIEDLNTYMLVTDNNDILKMYGRLLAASQRHLSSFTVHITPAY
jgi:hypothetical protein